MATIDLGFISIHIYSICILLGVIIGYVLFVKEAQRHGINKSDASDLIFYAILFGIVGARVWYCLFNLDYYLNSPISVFKVWEGGLAIHGGIIFGLVSIFVFCKKKDLDFVSILDYMAISLIIGQAIGRWGNFFNGEAHGGITSLTYLKSMHIPSFIIKGMYIDGNYYVPTFFYESLWCFLGFIIMYLIRDRVLSKKGFLTGFYLVWYGLGRLYIEGFRTDSLMFFSFKVAQVISVMMIIFGIVMFIHVYRRR